MEQLKLDLEVVPCDYNVYVSGRKPYHTNSERDAWDYIGKGSIGQLHEVKDRNGYTREEFVPF